jgi:ribosomal protein S18 acetylase RimI-like enzyme
VPAPALSKGPGLFILIIFLASYKNLSYNINMDTPIFRKATASDSQFAYNVKKLAFGEYIDQVWGWDEEQQQQLHRRRFASQEYSIIQWFGRDVGVLAMVREPECFKLNQLFILPDYQGKGIGRACMRQIIDDAATHKLSIKLQVLKVNSRAQEFFKGLGFRIIGDSDTHILMEKLP